MTSVFYETYALLYVFALRVRGLTVLSLLQGEGFAKLKKLHLINKRLIHSRMGLCDDVFQYPLGVILVVLLGVLNKTKGRPLWHTCQINRDSSW